MNKLKESLKKELIKMDKKGLSWFQAFILFGLLIIALIGMLHLGQKLIDEHNQYREYKQFCEERPTFCYCNLLGGCEFKTSWSSLDGLSEDTKALCELANKLDDKKIIFRAGCDIQEEEL
jgi:hypothetical protein